MNLKDLVKNSKKFALSEIKKYNPDFEDFYFIPVPIGIELAKKLNADVDIVKIGLYLMDCKVLQAQKEGIIEKHVEMSVEATKEILKDYDISEEIKNNIINCVEAHHGTKEYISIEAEICANADCYKFIHPKGVFTYASMLGRRFNDINKELEQLEYKLDEKYNVISLEIVKEELEEYYYQFKNMIKNAKGEKQWK